MDEKDIVPEVIGETISEKPEAEPNKVEAGSLEKEEDYKTKFEQVEKSYQELQKKLGEQGQELGFYRKQFQDWMVRNREKEEQEENLEDLRYSNPELYEKKLRIQEREQLKKELREEMQKAIEMERINLERRQLMEKYSDFEETEPKIAQRLRQPLTLEDYYILATYPNLKEKIKKEIETEKNKGTVVGRYYAESGSATKPGQTGPILTEREKEMARRFGLSEQEYIKRKQELGM